MKTIKQLREKALRVKDTFGTHPTGKDKPGSKPHPHTSALRRSAADMVRGYRNDPKNKKDGKVDYKNLQKKTGFELKKEEKTLTPAEKKKREQIAKAMEKDNPNMPMDKKMAIATATAKRVAEAAGKDIAAKMMKSKTMKAFAPKVAKMKDVSADDLEKMLPDYVPGAEIRKLFEAVEESAKGLAYRDMSRDKDFQRKDDDDDIKATDDDRKAADKNIVMQIRSVADLPKGGTIEFKDGKKTKLTQQMAKQLVAKFNSIQKPMDKKKFQDMAGASLNGLKQAVRIK